MQHEMIIHSPSQISNNFVSINTMIQQSKGPIIIPHLHLGLQTPSPSPTPTPTPPKENGRQERNQDHGLQGETRVIIALRKGGRVSEVEGPYEGGYPKKDPDEERVTQSEREASSFC